MVSFSATQVTSAACVVASAFFSRWFSSCSRAAGHGCQGTQIVGHSLSYGHQLLIHNVGLPGCPLRAPHSSTGLPPTLASPLVAILSRSDPHFSQRMGSSAGQHRIVCKVLASSGTHRNPTGNPSSASWNFGIAPRPCLIAAVLSPTAPGILDIPSSRYRLQANRPAVGPPPGPAGGQRCRGAALSWERQRCRPSSGTPRTGQQRMYLRVDRKCPCTARGGCRYSRVRLS